MHSGCTPWLPHVLLCFLKRFLAESAGILVRFVYNSFEQRVAARLRENHVSSQLDAASGLLQLTCEAVMELDDDFRLTEHCPKLAAMLLRGGSSTQGAASIYHGGSGSGGGGGGSHSGSVFSV